MGAANTCFASYPATFWGKAGLDGFVNNLDPEATIDGAFDNSPICGCMDDAISAANRAVQEVLGE